MQIRSSLVAGLVLCAIEISDSQTVRSCISRPPQASGPGYVALLWRRVRGMRTVFAPRSGVWPGSRGSVSSVDYLGYLASLYDMVRRWWSWQVICWSAAQLVKRSVAFVQIPFEWSALVGFLLTMSSRMGDVYCSGMLMRVCALFSRIEFGGVCLSRSLRLGQVLLKLR